METGRKPPPWQWGLLIAIMAASFAVYMDTVFRQFHPPPKPISKRELIALGTRADYHSDLIEKISRDLKLKKGVELVLGPGPFFPGGDMVELKLSYSILIGESFFLSLPEPEQRALIGHEMGHSVFVPPVCYDPIHGQVGADLLAAMYTSPEALISLLPKLSSDPYWTESREYRIRLEHLKLLLPEQGQ